MMPTLSATSKTEKEKSEGQRNNLKISQDCSDVLQMSIRSDKNGLKSENATSTY